MHIGFIAAKGGQGVTVTASLVATMLAKAGHDVVIVGDDETATALGVAVSDDGTAKVLDRLTLSPTPLDGRLNILDGQPGDYTLLVTTGCYMALRRAVKDDVKADGLIFVEQPARALTAHDAERAIGIPVVARVTYSPVIARAVDAGLLTYRGHAVEELQPLIDQLHAFA